MTLYGVRFVGTPDCNHPRNDAAGVGAGGRGVRGTTATGSSTPKHYYILLTGGDGCAPPSSLRLLPSGRKVRVRECEPESTEGVWVAVKGAPRHLLEKTLWATPADQPWVCSQEVVVSMASIRDYLAERSGGRPARLGSLHVRESSAKITQAKAVDGRHVRLRLERAVPCLQGLRCRVGSAPGTVALPLVPRGDIRPHASEDLETYRLRVAGFSYAPAARSGGEAGGDNVLPLPTTRLSPGVQRCGPWVFTPAKAQKLAASLRRAKAEGARAEDAAKTLGVEPVFLEDVVLSLRPSVSPAESAVLATVEAAPEPDGCFLPPDHRRLDPILDRLVADGLIYRLPGPAYIAEARLVDLCRTAEGIGDTSVFLEDDFRQAVSTSRNRAAGILALLASEGFITRAGGGRYKKRYTALPNDVNKGTR